MFPLRELYGWVADGERDTETNKKIGLPQTFRLKWLNHAPQSIWSNLSPIKLLLLRIRNKYEKYSVFAKCPCAINTSHTRAQEKNYDPFASLSLFLNHGFGGSVALSTVWELAQLHADGRLL